ncbi:MAG TPA: OmpA family protein, partial [Chitinophagaceae bacterium]|nr:OmpA family protein [Chitinophagaceae bacterium]
GFNNYFRDPKRAYAGEHCMAVEAGHSKKPFQRTFIRSQLVCGLRKGHQYRFECYVKSPHRILDSIGLLFTSHDPLVGTQSFRRILPSFFFARGIEQFARDSSWQKIVIDYTATGQEVFIAISNFSRRDLKGYTGIPMENHFFVFLDNISIKPLDQGEELCRDWQQSKIKLYEQDARHEFLRRLIKNQRNQPIIVHLSPNTISKTDTLVLPDVLFATARKDLRPASFLILDSFCRRMDFKGADSLVIEGHTDNTGNASLNERLAMDRAASVLDWLRRCTRLKSVPVATRGWGSRRPVADNNTAAGRQLNRRVQLLLYRRE